MLNRKSFCFTVLIVLAQKSDFPWTKFEFINRSLAVRAFRSRQAQNEEHDYSSSDLEEQMALEAQSSSSHGMSLGATQFHCFSSHGDGEIGKVGGGGTK